MSTIGGPGGIGGPKGPSGPDGPDGATDVAEVGDVSDVTSTDAATATMIDKLAADIAAGKLTPKEAIDRLVEATAGPELDAAARAELREMLADLVANDPFLGGLANRI
jgi:hypothetical protein